MIVRTLVVAAWGLLIHMLAAAQSPQSPTSGWVAMATVAQDKTNVRGAGNINAPVVTQLMPGQRVLVKRTEGDWWLVRAPDTSADLGWVRQDRLDGTAPAKEAASRGGANTSTEASSPQPAKVQKATAQKILRDFKKNSLRAQSQYSQGIEIVGIFVNASKLSYPENTLAVEIGDISLGSITAYMDSSETESVMKIDANRLVSISCADPNDGTYPKFRRCKNIKLYPLGGKMAKLVYDDLMINELKSDLSR
jgi:hypothetical protein